MGPLAAVASIGNSALGYFGQKDTNSTNRKIANARNAMEIEEAKKAREFSASEAAISRDWQEQMSNTAVSRAMADMKRAGINPALAGGSPASSPAGATGQSAKANIESYKYRSPIDRVDASAVLNSALSSERAVAEIDSIKAATELTKNRIATTDPLAEVSGALGS